MPKYPVGLVPISHCRCGAFFKPREWSKGPKPEIVLYTLCPKCRSLDRGSDGP